MSAKAAAQAPNIKPPTVVAINEQHIFYIYISKYNCGKNLFG